MKPTMNKSWKDLKKNLSQPAMVLSMNQAPK
jgi:hypothetical protein